MAVAVVGTPAAARDGIVASITTSFTLNASATFLLVPVSWSDNGTNTISTVTWNGVSCTQVTGASYEYLNGAIYAGVTWFYLNAPATGANNLVTTPTAGVWGITHGVIGLSGTDGSAPTFEASATGTANPATQATTSTAGNLVAGIAQFFTTVVANVTSNNTEAYEILDNIQDDQLINVAYDTATSPTMSWGNTGSVRWVMSVIEVAASGGAAAVIPVFMNQYRQRKA